MRWIANASWKPMMPRPTGRVAQVTAARFWDGVEINVDHIVEHANRNGNGFFNFLFIDTVWGGVRSQVDGAGAYKPQFHQQMY